MADVRPDTADRKCASGRFVPVPVRTLQPGDVTQDGFTVLRLTPLSGRLCVRFENDDTLWRMHGDSLVWIHRKECAA